MVQQHEKYVNRDVAVFDTMMQGFLKEGDLESAWSIFDECEVCGVERDASLYATLVQGLCKHFETAVNEERMRQFHNFESNQQLRRPLLSIMPRVQGKSKTVVFTVYILVYSFL